MSRVHDSIGSDGAGLFVAHADSGFHAGVHHQRLLAQKLATSLDQLPGDRRDDRGQADAVQAGRIDAGMIQEGNQAQTVFIRRPRDLRVQPPAGPQFFARVDPRATFVFPTSMVKSIRILPLTDSQSDEACRAAAGFFSRVDPERRHGRIEHQRSGAFRFPQQLIVNQPTRADVGRQVRDRPHETRGWFQGTAPEICPHMLVVAGCE